MIVFIDSVIVIYLIEGPDAFRVRAKARLAEVTAANDQTATSHLTRLECRVKPISGADPAIGDTAYRRESPASTGPAARRRRAGPSRRRRCRSLPRA